MNVENLNEYMQDLINEYLDTLDDISEDEGWGTELAYEVETFGRFAEWLQKTKGIVLNIKTLDDYRKDEQE